jgi:scyllo-inositol 2-dehydrogenase (NADP+)
MRGMLYAVYLCHHKKEKDQNMLKRRIVIVGCGGMGSGHALAITGREWQEKQEKGIYSVYTAQGTKNDTDITEKLELAGIYDIDPARCQWAAEHGFYCYESFEAVLSDPTVDIILVATPNHLHKDMCIRAMRAGKHVLCEKPVTISSAELLEVLKVSGETGKVFYPRQNRRWDKDYLIMKKIYEEKTLGEVFNIESRVHGSRGIPGDWRGIREYGGGMMLDWGVHLLDRMLMMVPEKVKKVFCSFTHITNREVDDGFKLHMAFESGITAVIEVGTCNFIKLPLWYMAGNHGTAMIEDWSCAGRIVLLKSWEDKDAKPIQAGEGLTKTMAPRGDNSVEEYPLPDVEYDRNELYSNLVDVINGEAEQIVKPEEALRTLRLMEAAFESAEKCRVVDFE